MAARITQVSNMYLVCFDSSMLWEIVMIEPLKVWHGITNLEFIIYLMVFQFHFSLSLVHALYFMNILA